MLTPLLTFCLRTHRACLRDISCLMRSFLWLARLLTPHPKHKQKGFEWFWTWLRWLQCTPVRKCKIQNQATCSEPQSRPNKSQMIPYSEKTKTNAKQNKKHTLTTFQTQIQKQNKKHQNMHITKKTSNTFQKIKTCPIRNNKTCPKHLELTSMNYVVV